MNKNWNREKIAAIVKWLGFVYFWYSFVLFFIYLSAPLLGGIILPAALIIYASKMGMAICIWYYAKKLQKSVKIKLYESVIGCMLFICCMFLWFPNPLNIIFSFLIILGSLISYRAQQRAI